MNFLPCSAELRSLFHASRELGRNPRKKRVDSGRASLEMGREIASTLFFPCSCESGAKPNGSPGPRRRGPKRAGQGEGRGVSVPARRALTPGNTGKKRGTTENREGDGGGWRRRRDSNPRDGSPSAPLAGVCLRPLGHVSVGGCIREAFRETRRFSWFGQSSTTMPGVLVALSRMGRNLCAPAEAGGFEGLAVGSGACGLTRCRSFPIRPDATGRAGRVRCRGRAWRAG